MDAEAKTANEAADAAPAERADRRPDRRSSCSCAWAGSSDDVGRKRVFALSRRSALSGIAWLALMQACVPVRPTSPLERLRFISSQATRASWSFVLEDRARSGELLIDGRTRANDCDRKGIQIRCELRGLFPGGHTVDLRLPNAVLHRSVWIGRPWPERPFMVRAESVEQIILAAEAGADAVVLDRLSEEKVDAAHLHGARVIAAGDASSIERYGTDGVLGAPIAADLGRRFPEARAFFLDKHASAELLAFASCHEAHVVDRSTLAETHDLFAASIAIVGKAGAVLDPAALALLKIRKAHPALRSGRSHVITRADCRLAVRLTEGKDTVDVWLNASPEPWTAPGSPKGEVSPQSAEIFIPTAPPDSTRF